jgi:hypothetical protein
VSVRFVLELVKNVSYIESSSFGICLKHLCSSCGLMEVKSFGLEELVQHVCPNHVGVGALKVWGHAPLENKCGVSVKMFGGVCKHVGSPAAWNWEKLGSQWRFLAVEQHPVNCELKAKLLFDMVHFIHIKKCFVPESSRSYPQLVLQGVVEGKWPTHDWTGKLLNDPKALRQANIVCCLSV